LTVGKTVLDRNILPLDIAGFVQTAVKCHESFRHRVARRTHQNSDCRHRRLLRPRRERPRRHAAEKRDERAPLHSITSSARASSVGGISDTKDLCRLEILNVRFAQRL